jgi:hypothetical protein
MSYDMLDIAAARLGRPVPEQLRKRIYDDLADAMIIALEQQKLSVAEMKRSSAYTLENLDNANSLGRLIVFLTSLSQRWSVYSSVCNTYIKEINSL